ncbi:dnaJ homolog subfamily C member 16-like isoform X1 [Phycodurus eques]|uniref:dnaJ homolog subfamily C member 16-like isoform X1 n=2 Tax=Phycodurus eques TaxID=693459 RepID=UPI002ACDB9C9|nr:dnaJ homolog subfamily C member 16-like isoform X1 [Phycodurus eques]
MSLPLAVIVVLSVLELGVNHAGPELDPYKTLGVTKGASQVEIKKVYKRLAREWHPDKNKNPGAEDMFIRITKSYEILSSEDKRANYDRYGQTDDTQPYGSGHYSGHRHDNFNFEESYFNFPFNSKSHRDFSDSKYSLHFNQYVNDVVPDSFRRPYLIKITSDWCFNCIHIEPVWKEVVQEMETLGLESTRHLVAEIWRYIFKGCAWAQLICAGVGIGVVDVGYERRLANHLGAHRTPSILGVINGKVTFFHFAVAKEHLRQFVEDLLPQRLVEWVSDKNDQQFLNSWHKLNKPHVLLFDQVPVVPLLYKLTAFAYKDYMQFGYVDQGLSETASLQRQFNINTYAPTMLVFKENTDNPADIIQTKGMKKQIIDEFMSNNKFLLAPRLVNQKLFDELCPVKQFHRRRKYCVLLMTGDGESFSPGKQAFLSFASSNTKEVVRFAYVYQQLQQPLCNILMTSKDSTQGPLPPQVVILERRNAAGKAFFKPVTIWNGSEEDKQRLVEELERLQKDPSILIHDAMLPELNNEFASIFVIQWVYAFYDYLSEVIDDILHNNWREMMPLLSLIFSALFILFGTVVIQAFSDSSDENSAKPKAKDGPKTENGSSGSGGASSRPPKKNFVEVTELTDITYISNLVRLRQGHMNIVLVITDASKNILLSKFAKEVYSFTGILTLHFSFLNTDKHSEWMCTLLNSAQDSAHIDACHDDEVSANMDYTGYVLALNGHKKYFCLFKPVYTGEDPDSKTPENESGTLVRRPRAASRDDHPQRKSARSRSTSTLQIHHKLDRLGLWMERLRECTLPRYYILAWPGLDKITPSK